MLRGKAHAKTILCLKIGNEAMEHLLINRIIEEEKDEVTKPEAPVNLIQTYCSKTLDLILEDSPLSP